MRRPRSGGGWKAIGYSMKLARRVGFLNMWRAMRSKNTCKTCAVGMGGQLGGMVNEGGHFPEVCKKSFQAMASDMQGALRTDVIEKLSLNQLRAMTSRQLEMSGRISEPLYMAKGASSYKVTTWDHAISTLVERMQAAGPERSFFYASGRASNEAGFLFQMLARLFGTNYVNNCSYYCHQASGVGLGMAIGTGAGTVRLEDLQHTDLYILVGANPSSNHPRLMRSLMEMRRNGGRIIVVNPMRELGLENFRVPSDVRSLLFGTQIASQYVQPHIGGDLALLTGIAKDVIERSGHDKKFIAEHTEGFEDFLQTVQATSWNEIVIQSGMVGRAHAGVMPIRGHSNVQGLGTVGVTPVLKQNMLERFEKQLGIKPPTSPGFDTMACMDAAHAGSMDFALCLGGNLYGSNPNSKRAFDAIRKLKTLVYFSTTLNTGHAWGTGEETFILPVLPRDEEQQATTQESMFSYVRLSDGGPTRHGNVRSEVSILAEIGRQIFPNDKRLDWSKMQSHAAIRELIADLIPGYEELKLIDATKQEFHVPGRSVDHYQFPTASGKAKFHATQLPEQNLSPGQLRLMTMRSEGQFNSVVYDEEDLYRGQERRDVILMNAADIKQLGLHPEQRIKIKSDTGEMRYILVREFDIRAGNVAMYYPESNVLIPSTVDPLSKTPAFKSIAVTITAESDV